jgi:hypothetical protein
VCTEAVAVVRAVGADFFLDRWDVEIEKINLRTMTSVNVTITLIDISRSEFHIITLFGPEENLAFDR